MANAVVRHLLAMRSVAARSSAPRAEPSSLLPAACGLTAVHAAAFAIVGPDPAHSFSASWANVTLHGRPWTLLTSQLQHSSAGHVLAYGATLMASAAALQGQMHPVGFVGCVLASGTAAAVASVTRTVLVHAPPDALPILLGGPPRRPPSVAPPTPTLAAADELSAREPAAGGECDADVFDAPLDAPSAADEGWRDGAAARARLRIRLLRAGPTRAVRDFHEFVNEVDAQLRLGVVDGVDRRREVPLLVERYRPYKRWMEESVRGSPAVASASALGAVGSLLVHATARRLGPSALAALGASAVGLLASDLGRRWPSSRSGPKEEGQGDEDWEWVAVHGVGWATGMGLGLVGLLVGPRF
eukprot:Transcript_29930.p1 GENE.Transcript_29930~~Transcript_29930.p1  ORF type:complete len:382 (+),score=58.92 Transcript_29930:74-1147(+)